MAMCSKATTEAAQRCAQPQWLSRRRCLVGLLAGASQTACSQEVPTNAAPAVRDAAYWKRKFGDLKGGELFVDAFGRKNAVMIYREDGSRFYSSATLHPRNASHYTYGAEFGVPITLRVVWRTGETRATPDGNDYQGGTIAGDFTVPVAERIPDEVLHDLRKNGGGFRLKLRVHDDGLLVGWDIRRGLGFFMTGGDFKEARVVYLGSGNETQSRRERGWYIHPKTKERIETDF
jgi:hypothetical protein